jgi:acyl-CoA reductase-like NAD-dependent aldehyde dehydrogenase
LILKIPKNLNIENRPFINGSFKSLKKNKFLKRKSPALDYVLPKLFLCRENEVNYAVDTAKKSFQEGVWKNKSSKEKKKIFLNVARKMKKNIQELSILDCLETGRAINNFKKDSIPKAIEVIEYFAESIDKIYDNMTPLNLKSMGLITKQPLGVVVGITSWNDPLVPAMWKACPAMLMGNSIIMKPSELSSFSLLRLAELFFEAGLPKGILNIVTGDGITAEKLIKHSDTSGIYFTGSTKTGQKISQIASKNRIKKVSLECGGKSSFIVTKNCSNLNKAAKILAKNIFYNQGQTCSAPSRLIIDKKISSLFLDKLFVETEKYIPGNPLDYNSEVGGLITKKHYKNVKKFFDIGIKEKNNAKIFTKNQWKKKYSFPPVIFYNLKSNSKLLQEEIFGPILSCIEYSTIEEALKIANNSQYGLASSVWSNNFEEIHYLINSIEAGIIHINSYGEDENNIPFGGIKNSGFGRDKSIFAFQEYTYIKSIVYKQ